ncbi:MAG TPA: two-component regulator propeller domain-containing protein [Acidobacteriaceae bacterium]
MWLLLLAFLPNAPGGWAAAHAPRAPKPAQPDYTRRLWRVQDGLPEDTVQALAQSADGYLWAGTTGGLARFDGSQFSILGQSNTPDLKLAASAGDEALRDNSIFCLLSARDGSLWFGSEGSGLLHYRQGHVESFAAAQGLTDGFVRSLLEDERGRLWIGTDNGLFQLDPTALGSPHVRRIDVPGFMRPIAVHAIAEDREHRLWVGGSRLVTISPDLTSTPGARPGQVTEQTLPGAYSQNRVKSILQTADGALWVGTIGGLDRLAHGRFTSVAGVTGTVRALRQTSDGTLWIGTIGHGLWTLRNGRMMHMGPTGLLPSNTVLSIYEDHEAQVWVGTQEGMVRLSRTPVHVLPLPGGSDPDFETISRDGETGLWVVSSRVFRVTAGVAHPYAFPGLGTTSVRNVYRDRAGELWVGTDGSGAFHLTRHGAVHYAAPAGLTNNFVRAFLEDRQGGMWIATDEGLSRIDARGVRKYGMGDGLAYFSTRCLLEDDQGDVWIGTEQGLSHWHAGAFVQDQLTHAMRGQKVWSLVEDRSGYLWVGTRDHGLFRYRRGTVARFTTAQGLASNSIYQILDDGAGRLWLSGPTTLSSIPLAQLQADPPSASLLLNVAVYDMPYGADDAQFYGGRQPSGSLDAMGRVWFPSSKGAVYVAPGDAIAPNRPAPRVILRSLVVDGRALNPSAAGAIVPAHASRLEFSYAPLLLRSQRGIRFRYRLDGFETHWNYAGEAHTASYTNLPAGHYRFEVVAFSVDDPGVTSIDTLSVEKQPYYYQTRWFWAMCLLLLVGGAWTIYHSRIRGLRLRFDAVLAERSRLAREMHDTVIQGCTSISALLEAIASQQRRSDPSAADQNTLLGYARTQVRATIDEAREAVWNLRHGEEPEHDLLASLQTLAVHTTRESGIAVDCSSEGRPFRVAGSQAHEVLMTVREAIYNAVLHGRPQRIGVEARFASRQLEIRVLDDGSGFVPEKSPDASGNHYGIMGMRERIDRVGGSLRLTSVLGRGTEVAITLKRRGQGASRSGLA